MYTEYKGKISILIFIIFLASIIPFCMISSYRESLIQNRINELSISRQKNELGLNRIFENKNHQQISMRKGEQRE
jgi:hypothetical protein